MAAAGRTVFSPKPQKRNEIFPTWLYDEYSFIVFHGENAKQQTEGREPRIIEWPGSSIKLTPTTPRSTAENDAARC
jgi:hypothetical protein